MDYNPDNEWCGNCIADKDYCPDCYQEDKDSKPSLYKSPSANLPTEVT